MNKHCSSSGQHHWGDDMQSVWGLVIKIWQKRTSCFTFVFLRWINGLDNMPTVLLAYSPLNSICLYLIAFWQSNTQTGMIPDVGHHTPRQRHTVTFWIRLLHVRKRHVSFEEQYKGPQISRLSLNIFLDITGMILICSDIEHLFYLSVILSVWIPHTKITIEYYDWFIRLTRFVAWFNMSVVTYTTGTRTSVSDILCGTQHYEFSV